MSDRSPFIFMVVVVISVTLVMLVAAVVASYTAVRYNQEIICPDFKATGVHVKSLQNGRHEIYWPDGSSVYQWDRDRQCVVRTLPEAK